MADVGNALFVGATVSLNLGLTWGGVTYSWGDFRVLLSLVLGLAGYAFYFVWEGHIENPTTPLAIFSTRTANASMLCIGIQSLMHSICILYFPLWLQSVQLKSAKSSGVLLLPFSASFEVVGILTGVWCATTRTYKLQNVILWPFVLIGFVFMALLHYDTAAIGWIGTFLWLGLSLGFIADIWTLPLLAALSPTVASQALAFGSVSRYTSMVAGTSIGITIVQNRLRQRLPADFLALLPKGQDIAYLGIERIPEVARESQPQIREAYCDSLRTVWFVLIAPAAVALLVSLCIKELPMSTVINDQTAEMNRLKLKSTSPGKAGA